ncbi:hypothetical protein D9619_008333 [Psilocybe cf. subviscida]|uniref:Uncharacterized protein n=1 Tax=Psilocybe cf. subviscida TaxID=2480587 RepID=A0A8H5BA78_9AGAR|nr:hypothetical protein D9619_008333 [Psilocybe cf. subviscida]
MNPSSPPPRPGLQSFSLNNRASRRTSLKLKLHTMSPSSPALRPNELRPHLSPPCVGAPDAHWPTAPPLCPAMLRWIQAPSRCRCLSDIPYPPSHRITSHSDDDKSHSVPSYRFLSCPVLPALPRPILLHPSRNSRRGARGIRRN